MRTRMARSGFVKWFTIGARLGFTLGFAAAANATLIAYDSFQSYTNGAALHGLAGGSGWTSAWTGDTSLVTVESGSITGAFRSMQINKSVDDENVIERGFTSQTGTLYVGFLLRTTGGFDSADFIQTYLNDAPGAVMYPSLSVGVRQVASNPFFARGSIPPTANATVSSTTAFHTDNTTRQVVLKMTKSASTYDRSDIYVDRANETTADATAVTNTTLTALSRIHFRIYQIEAGQKLYYDNVRVATTYAEALGPPEWVAWSAAGSSNVTTDAAAVFSTLEGTNADVKLVWDTEDRGATLAGWANTNAVGSNLATGCIANANTALTNLLSGQQYYFRFFATNTVQGFSAFSDVATFSTFGLPIVNNGGGPTGIGLGSAALRGALVSDGGTNATVYTFWGPSDKGTNAADWAYAFTNSPAAGATFTNALSNLYYGVRYYYRVCGSNSYGLGWAAASSNFVTLAPVGGYAVSDAVGVNFVGTGASMATGETAGAVERYAFWNNCGGSGGTSNNLMNSAGTNSGLSVTWSGFGGTWTAGNSGAGDENLMSGYLDLTGGGQIGSLSVSGITAPRFRVYAYFGSDGDGRNGQIGINNGGPTNSYSTYSSSGKTFPGAYTLTSDTGTGYPNANYAVWSNRTGTGFTLSQIRGVNNSGAHGLQILLERALTGFVLSNTPATGLTATSAVLNTALTASGAVFDVWAYWGRVSGETNAAAWSNAVFAGTCTNGNASPVSATATGLTPGLTYYFTFQASNTLESFWATNVLSVTPGAGSIPDVDTFAPIAVGTVSADVRGELVSEGAGAASLFVLHGPADASVSGDWASTNPVANPATMGIAYTSTLTVVADGSYYYRFAASNSAGWGYGPVRSFITAPVTVTKDADASEIGLTPGTFTVHRASTATNFATVVSFMVGGSASNGTDYVAIPTNITLAAGSAASSFAVVPRFDRLNEGTETIQVTLSPGLYPLGTPSSATMDVADDPAVASGGLSLIWDNASANGQWDLTSLNWHQPGESNGTCLYMNGDHVAFRNSGTGTVVVQAGGVAAGSLVVSNTAGVYTFTNGAISSSGALSKFGGGTLRLCTDNSGIAGGIALSGTGYTYFVTNTAMGPVHSVTIADGSVADIAFTGFGGSSSAGDLARLNTASRGTLVFDRNSTNDLDFRGYWAGLRLGSAKSLGTSIDKARFQGTLTPAGDVYRFGGGGRIVQVDKVIGDGSAARGVDHDDAGVAPATAGTRTMLVLSKANTYTGPTRVCNGDLRLTGAEGSAANSAEFIVGYNAILGLDPAMRRSGWGDEANVTAGNVNDRIGDSATLRLRGGTLYFYGNPNTGTAETIGTLDVQAGGSTIDARCTNHTWALVDDNLVTHGTLTGTQSAELTFSTVTRGTQDGHVLVRGVNLGGAGATGASRVKFTTPPAMLGAGGAAGTPGVSIVPYMYTDGAGLRFVTHDANGIRPLDTNTEYTAFTVGATSSNNAIIADTGSVTYAVSSDTTYNALCYHGSGQNTTINGSGRLILTGGLLALRLRAPNDGATWVLSAPMDFGGREGQIFYTGRMYCDAQLNSALTNDGGNGVSFSAQGWTLKIGGASQYTGPTTINSGSFEITGNEKLPNTSALRVRAGATLRITDSATETVASLAGAGTLALGNTSSRLILGSGSGAGGAVTLGGPTAFLEPGDNGAGALTLSGVSAVQLTNGEFRVTANSPYENGMLAVGSASVTLGAELVVTLDYAPAAGDAFRIIDKAGTAPVTGTFSNGPDLFIGAGGRSYRATILYNSALAGGDGNDVVVRIDGVGSLGTVFTMR